jgi:hypothetical protein
MLKDHPDLQGFQNPILLAVYRAEINLGGHLTPKEQYSSVQKEWKPLVNGEHAEPGSFGVVFETIVKKCKVKEEVEASLALEIYHQPKRKSREGYGLECEDEDEDEDAHWHKRQK